MAWALGGDDIEHVPNRIRKLLGMVQGGPPEGFLNKAKALMDLIKVAGSQPKMVRNAPCQEVVLTDSDIDLYKFPVLKCWPMDGGPFITLPLVLDYLHNDALSGGIDSTYAVSEFYSFIMILTFALGLTFQLPLIVFITVKANLITVDKLKSYRPHLIVTFFLFSALITPPDIISQFLLAIPLIVLYEISLFVARFLE